MQNIKKLVKKIFLLAVLILISHLSFAIGHLGIVFAQSMLSYPIPELGYCRDAKECWTWCEIPRNKAACWSYGKYRLGSQVLGEQTPAHSEMEEKARALGITFPILELGDCPNVAECRAYCEGEENHGACLSFARKHGLHQEINEEKIAELMEKARGELGCTSQSSCHAFCDREENHDRCITFATRHGLHRAADGGFNKATLLRKAQTELGCDSMETCWKFCEANQADCLEFARKHGLLRDEVDDQEFEGIPGKCSTVKECEHYCREHEEECQQYFKREKKFTGPGGCHSEESCRAYCENHPDECSGFTKEAKGYLGPSGCRTEHECKAFCEAHPEECPGFDESKDYQDLKNEIEKFGEEFKQLTQEEQQRLIKENQQYYEQYGKDLLEEFYPEEKDFPLEKLAKICQEHGCVWQEKSCRCD